MQNARAWWTTSVVVLLLMCMSALVAAFGMRFTASAAQTVPHRVHFQGRLVDATGNPRPDGLYVMNFGFYSSPTGGTWYGDETCQQTDRVQVRNGIFSVQLGSCASTISPSLFSQYPVYVEVQIPTPATATCATAGCANWSEPAMTPRLLVGSSPYALNSDTLDGLDADAFAQVAANNTFTGTTTFRSSTNSTSAFAIQNSAGASLLVADTTNMQLKVGGGDVSPNGTPALLVVDHKSTTGDPAGVNGAMYYNAAAKKFRCHQDGAWKDCIGSKEMSYRDGYRYQSDLTFGTYGGSNAVLDATLNHYIAGSVTTTMLPSEAGRPGIARTTATNQGISGVLASMDVSSVAVSFGSGAPWSYTTSARLTGFTAETSFRAGFLNAIQTTTESGVTAGCYFRYLSSSSAAWLGACINGSGNLTTCDTGATVGSGTWHSLNVTVNSAGTLATFTVDDTYQCTVSTNIPSGLMAFGHSTYRSPTGAISPQTADVDYIDVRSDFAR